MLNILDHISAGRRFLAAVVFAAAALSAAPGIAEAQSVIAVVNGDPITQFDLEQRTKLMQISGSKPASRQQVVDELIEEKLKLQLLRRFTIETIDTEVDNAVNNMARRTRMTPSQFLEQLSKANVSPNTLKSRIKAEIVWTQVIRGRYPSAFQISDKDIEAKLGISDGKAATGFDYTLRPILFIVPRGSPDTAIAARAREAEALRGRFQGCNEGMALARQLRDVAVRTPVTRSTADLSPQLREVLEKTEIGRLTSPEITQQGVEVYALCGKAPSSSENAPGKREVRDQLQQQNFQAQAARYLKELRSQAMIEYR